MIVFATSDKGGTGRSVTSCNLVYQAALRGLNVGYLDWDFGSPTAGAIFGVDSLNRGTRSGRGQHAYFLGQVLEPETVDIWAASDRNSLRHRPPGSGRMELLPGDEGQGEFRVGEGPIVQRALDILRWAQNEYDLTVVDLSAGRSYALRMALTATRPDENVGRSRWLVFHRWTMQHLTAAHGLVHGAQGLLDTGTKVGHDREDLLDRIRFVRTAIIDPNAPDLRGLRTSQLSWLSERNAELHLRARELELGARWVLGSIPVDPVFQWHEQLLTSSDLYGRETANKVTVDALHDLSLAVLDDDAWEPR
ncbi:SCO2523 family variant P-loop protein [Kineosporia succinea]|uniref:CobQ/CobB/MinD/ParA family nucleotide binding protein n=1 Tax=Kineosporia succinea TaxID=84632 RepID=A0ABT9PF36_9ACTN|nr:SCO2523 family variant P-loop protein [Kineosporia succinea]MDP9830790.1 hypothetical protein [Kineosporia succinea]